MQTRTERSGGKFQRGVRQRAEPGLTPVQKRPAAQPHAFNPQPDGSLILFQPECPAVDRTAAFAVMIRQRVETARHAHLSGQFTGCCRDVFQIFFLEKAEFPDAVQIQFLHDGCSPDCNG